MKKKNKESITLKVWIVEGFETDDGRGQGLGVVKRASERLSMFYCSVWVVISRGFTLSFWILIYIYIDFTNKYHIIYIFNTLNIYILYIFI